MSSVPPTDKDRPTTGQPSSSPSAPQERPVTPERTVPPPEHQRRTYESPAKPRGAHSSEFRDGTLGEKRLMLLADLKYAIPEENLGNVLEYLYPKLKHGIDVAQIMASLRADGTIAQNGKWSQFQQKPSAGNAESTAFDPLEGIFDKVVEHAHRQTKDLAQTVDLRLLPNHVPWSDRASTTKPDGCFMLKEEKKNSQEHDAVVYSWYNIALTCEFKLRNVPKALDDDVTKVVFSMQHTMTLDPCRRFTFGISIENTSVRLWFCSRSVVIVSKPFDFVDEPEILVRVFLSLAFANQTELGWDPTIKVVDPDADKRVYHIQVTDKWYEVLDVLSNFGADAIIGRATRVFKVKELDPEGGGKECVLKDVWVEDGRDLEHDIHARILADVKRQYGGKKRTLVESHLLKPINHWLVKVDGKVDHTTGVIMNGLIPSKENIFELRAQEINEDDVTKSVGFPKPTDKKVHEELNTHLGSRLGPTEPKVVFHHRRHYRVVYEEVALPIWTITVLRDVFVVLRDCARALKYIHGSGWVHRDISAGNVYLFGGRGLMGDLEYAKKMSVDGSHEMRTGTPDFMAIEVAQNRYLFLPSDVSPSESESDSGSDSNSDSETETDSSDEDAKEEYEMAKQRRAERPAFVHNEAHDIESLWWVAIYILYFNGDVDLAENETRTQIHSREIWMQRVFSTSTAANRDYFFKDTDHFIAGTEWFPRSFGDVAPHLMKLRKILLSCYIKFERAFPAIKKQRFKGIQNKARKSFKRCLLAANDTKIQSYTVLGRKLQMSISNRSHGGPANVPPQGRVPSGQKNLGLVKDDSPKEPEVTVKDAPPKRPKRILKLRRP